MMTINHNGSGYGTEGGSEAIDAYRASKFVMQTAA